MILLKQVWLFFKPTMWLIACNIKIQHFYQHFLKVSFNAWIYLKQIPSLTRKSIRNNWILSFRQYCFKCYCFTYTHIGCDKSPNSHWAWGQVFAQATSWPFMGLLGPNTAWCPLQGLDLYMDCPGGPAELTLVLNY